MSKSIAFLLLCCLQQSYAYIKDFDFQISTPYSKILREEFGLAENGGIELEIKSSDDLENGYLMIIVVESNMFKGWYEDVPSGFMNTDDINKYCYSPSSYRILLSVSTGISIKIEQANKYTVLLFQCQEMLTNNTIHLNVHLSMFNLRPYDDKKSYLPIEFTPIVTALKFELCFLVIMLVGYFAVLVAR